MYIECLHIGMLAYACFLDVSKAFDKLIHLILFKKRKQLGYPVYLEKVLIYSYQEQKHSLG